MSIEDVTARVNGAKAGTTDAEAFAARRDRGYQVSRRRIPGCVPTITLYQVVNKPLSLQEAHRCPPRVCAGVSGCFFGGDPDNFNFPRQHHMALVRVYENDQPIHPENYFNTTGTKEGSLVFVTGNPDRSRPHCRAPTAIAIRASLIICVCSRRRCLQPSLKAKKRVERRTS